jgi:hypothetical protein
MFWDVIREKFQTVFIDVRFDLAALPRHVIRDDIILRNFMERALHRGYGVGSFERGCS